MLGPSPATRRTTPAGGRSTPPSGNAPARIFGPGRSASTATCRPSVGADLADHRPAGRGAPRSAPWLRLSRHDVDAGPEQLLQRRPGRPTPGRAWPRSSSAGSTRYLRVRAQSISTRLNGRVQELLDYLDASPSPWHAAAVGRRPARRGRVRRARRDRSRGRRCRRRVHPARRRPRRLAPRRRQPGRGLRIVGAHTDSPGCASSRIPTRPSPTGGCSASRSTAACCSTAGSTATSASPAGSSPPTARRRSSTSREPVARVPQLAIHLDREVNERGLVLDRHVHLRPVWATGSSPAATSPTGSPSAPASTPAFWELCLYDVQPAAVLGADRSLIASGRLDNQVSCWAAIVGAWRRPSPVRHIARDRAVRPRGGRLGVGRAGRQGRCSPTSSSASSPGPASTPSTTSAGCSPRRAACRPTTPTPSTPTTPSATTPATPRSSTTARRSSSTPTSATPPTRRRRRCSGRAARRPACRCRRSCRATTCRAGRRSGRSRRPGSGSPPSTSACPQLSMHSARELCGAADPAHLVAALAAYWS